MVQCVGSVEEGAPVVAGATFFVASTTTGAGAMTGTGGAILFIGVTSVEAGAPAGMGAAIVFTSMAIAASVAACKKSVAGATVVTYA